MHPLLAHQGATGEGEVDVVDVKLFIVYGLLITYSGHETCTRRNLFIDYNIVVAIKKLITFM